MDATLSLRAIKRYGAAGFISLLGLVLVVPNVRHLVRLRGSPPGLIVAGVGALIAAVLVVAGYLLVREGFTPRHMLRIAGWAALGTVLLGLVLALLVLAGVDLPTYGVATLLSVSTFAHVVIGVRDVQRIRAEDLARQREQLAVLNRLVRHNLRHVSQRLLGIGSRLPAAATERERGDIEADVRAIAGELSEMDDMLDRGQAVINRDHIRPTAIDLADVIDELVSASREEHPDATFELDLPSECRVRAGDELRRALGELIENALVHAGDAPRVEISARRRGSRVALSVADDGPGMPEGERAVVTREAEIDQLTHSQGLGLWFVRWVMDAYDGQLDIESDENGTTVTLTLPRARP